ncbi:MAG: pyruvate kinase [Bacillota bacterium]
MDYLITATLGPASLSETVWSEMLLIGVDAFRLNTSHLSVEEVLSWVDRLNRFYLSGEKKVPVILDLQGSKWRLGEFASRELTDGETISLDFSRSPDNENSLPVPHMDFFKAADLSGDQIILNDAKIVLSVIERSEKNIKAKVLKGGIISSKKGITYNSSGFRKEHLSEKDLDIVRQFRHYDFIRYAISYIKDAEEMALYRSQIGKDAYLIAKLERGSATNGVIEIARYSDELWVCRGDLGAELGLKEMAVAVDKISEKLPLINLPVIMAGQVLEHMTQQSTPTRSEICYIYDSLKKGYKGFVLSDECAIGINPLESCRTCAMFR